MMKKTLTTLIVLLLLLGLAHAGEKRIEVPIGDSPSLGPADAPVTIIEFIDFQ
jgi:ABC-type glycerol-3-phosphate transport system substrate-binding protein